MAQARLDAEYLERWSGSRSTQETDPHNLMIDGMEVEVRAKKESRMSLRLQV